MMASHYLHSKINNQAIQTLRKGDNQKALELFKKALNLLMTEMRENADQDKSKRLHPLSLETEEILLHHHSHQSQVHAIDGHIYTQTFPLIENYLTCFSSELMADQNIRSAIIVFNIAILLHVKGMQEYSIVCLRKAKNLYEQAIRLIARLISGPENNDRSLLTGNPLIDLIVVALWNNLAYITLELKEFSTSDLYFGNVIKFSLRIRELTNNYSISGRQMSSFMEKQSEQFLLNARFSQIFISSAAPAA